LPHPDDIELADAVRAVRDGLMAAAVEGADAPVRFEVGPIEMEFTVEIRRETGGKAGVKAWVLNAEADARASHGSTHRVAFTLTPREAATGRGWEIGNEDPGSTALFDPTH
jgi:hypothetical protein